MANKTDLIQQLTEDLTPVKPMAPLGFRFFLWLIGSLVLVTGLMWFVQEFRSGFEAQLGLNRFTLENLVGLLAFAGCGFVALRNSTPGYYDSRSSLWYLGLSFFGFAGLMIYGHVAGSSIPVSGHGARVACWLEVLVFSWIPLLWLSQMARNSASPSFLNIALFIALAASSLPMVLMQVACKYSPMHNLLFHWLPSVVVIVFAGLMFRQILAPKY